MTDAKTYTDADLLKVCAEILGDGMYFDPRHDGIENDDEVLFPLHNLDDAFVVAMASGALFSVGRMFALAEPLKATRKLPEQVDHDGTPESAARALCVAVLKAKGAIE